MSDNLGYTEGAGKNVSTDELGDGSHAQQVKLLYSANGDGTRIPADADGLVVNLGTNNDVTVAALPLPSGAATSAKQDTEIASLASLDGKTPVLGQALAAASVPVVLTAAQLTTLTPPAAIAGFATSAKQDTGNASLASIDGKITAVNTGAVTVASSALPSGASTGAKQDTGNTSLASIDGKITAVNTGAVVVASSALPSGAATLAEQQSQTTSLQLIDDAVATTGSAIPAKGLAVVGTDGTNARVLKTDTAGELQIDVLTMPTTTVTGTVAATQSGAWNVTNISGTISLPTGASTLAEQQSQTTALQTIDNFISGSRGLVTEDNSAAIKTAVEIIDNFISGSRGLVTEDSAAAIKTAVEVMDDWDESDRAKVNPIVGQAGVQGASGAVSANTQRVVLATDVALPAGTNAIGKLAANSGVDIGDVDVLTLPAITGTVTANAGSNLNTSNLALEATLQSVKTAVEVIDNFISGSKGLVTEDNSAAILAAFSTLSTAANQTTSIASLATIAAYLAGLSLEQGATGASQVGPLVQGRVSDSPNSYVDGELRPASLTVDGRLRVTTASEVQNYTPWGSPWAWGTDDSPSASYPLTAW